MSDSEMFVGGQDRLGSELGKSGTAAGGQERSYKAVEAKSLEYIMASGLGSRGGPNKESNKFRSCPNSYLSH